MNERLGRYELLKKLAAGGMAEIWLARQAAVEGFEKLVVIKRIHAHLIARPEFVEMFLDEARLAARLSHPNVVQIFDLGAEGKSYYIAMEYVHGENLRAVSRRVAQRGDLVSPAVAAWIVAQACQGLHYAHSLTDAAGRPLKVVHRDVTPHNILVGYDGQVKLADFGIAKAASQVHETRSGVIKGKFSYMSPEQCRGMRLDARSDLFSLGIVLWELVTGRRLYARKREMDALSEICNEPPPRPSEVVHVPPPLEAVILKALEKDPEDRFESAAEMGEALERFLRVWPDIVTGTTVSGWFDTLFRDRIEAWRDLFAQPDDRVVSEIIERPDLFDGDPGSPGDDGQTEADTFEFEAPDTTGPSASTSPDDEPSTARGDPDRDRIPTIAVADALPERDRIPTVPIADAAPPSDRIPTVPLADAMPGGDRIPTVPFADAAPSRDRIPTVPVVKAAPPAARPPAEPPRGPAPPAPSAPPAPRPRPRPRAAARPRAGASRTDDEVLLSRDTAERALPRPSKRLGRFIAVGVVAAAALGAGAAVLVHANRVGPDAPPAAPTPRRTVTPAPTTTPPPAATPAPRPTPKPAATPRTKPPPPSPAKPSAEPRHATHRTHRKPRALAPGVLFFDATPWCKVYLDGTYVGTTPMGKRTIAAGHHALRCVNPETGTRELTLDVAPGQVVRRKLGATGSGRRP